MIAHAAIVPVVRQARINAIAEIRIRAGITGLITARRARRMPRVGHHPCRYIANVPCTIVAIVNDRKVSGRGVTAVLGIVVSKWVLAGFTHAVVLRACVAVITVA